MGYSHQFCHRALYKEKKEVKRRKGRGREKYKVPHVVASSISVPIYLLNIKYVL